MIKWRAKFSDPAYCAAIRADERNDCTYYIACLGDIAKKKHGKFIPCRKCDKYEKEKKPDPHADRWS